MKGYGFGQMFSTSTARHYRRSRYVLQSVDDVFPLTREEESGLEEAARSRGEGLAPDEFRAELEGNSRR